MHMAGVPVRVLVADDEHAMAAGTAAALDTGTDFELVGVAASAVEAAQLAAVVHPDVALVHAGLRGGGEAAVEALLRAAPGTRVLAHSGAEDHQEVLHMLRAGASGYVVRDASPDRLASALLGAAAGSSVFDDVVGRNGFPSLMDQLLAAQEAHEARAEKRARVLDALESDRLDIVFQPIVELATRRVVGHEALARFTTHPERGPAIWFQEAHDVGLGVELELRAIEKACLRSDELPPGTFLAVNVSPATTERADLVALLEAAHVDQIVLEVTEHARVDDYPRFRVAIERVREAGARLAVDDAGAGFSSLRHVLELDAELIKLDGSLTRALEVDPRRRSLAAALIEFGRQSGTAVLAEHVESELQLNELLRLGVQYGQGYLLGRPQRTPVAA
jgi:EAL domain-containing protein (putative c-di-GMP-specific phosphodiesterase class I)/AmiR/NasT family two-component response regulator